MKPDQNKVNSAKEVLLLNFLSGASPQETMKTLLEEDRFSLEELRAAALEMLGELNGRD